MHARTDWTAPAAWPRNSSNLDKTGENQRQWRTWSVSECWRFCCKSVTAETHKYQQLRKSQRNNTPSPHNPYTSTIIKCPTEQTHLNWLSGWTATCTSGMCELQALSSALTVSYIALRDKEIFTFIDNCFSIHTSVKIKIAIVYTAAEGRPPSEKF